MYFLVDSGVYEKYLLLYLVDIGCISKRVK